MTKNTEHAATKAATEPAIKPIALGGNQPQSPGNTGKPGADHKGGNQPANAGKPEAKAGNQPQPVGKPDAACAEMKQKMEAAGTPGPAHKALEPMIGNWKAQVSCWKDGAGEAHVSHGTAKTSWILQGRFLQEEFSGEMMGRPFKGLTLLGYDNTKQTYNMVWLADTQTSMFTCEGKGTEGNKVITLEGQCTCPTTGAQKALKSVYRLTGADQHVFEMYHDGKKTLEVAYTRA